MKLRRPFACGALRNDVTGPPAKLEYLTFTRRITYLRISESTFQVSAKHVLGTLVVEMI